MLTLKEKVDAIAAKYNLSIREVAERCNITVATFQCVYLGKRSMSLRDAVAFCHYFKLDLSDFVGYVNDGDHEIPLGNLRFHHYRKQWEAKFPHMERGPFYKNYFDTKEEAVKAIEAYHRGEYDPFKNSASAVLIEKLRPSKHPRPDTPFNAYPKLKVAK